MDSLLEGEGVIRKGLTARELAKKLKVREKGAITGKGAAKEGRLLELDLERG